MRNKLTAAAVNGILTFCAVFGGVGCMVSGFSLERLQLAPVALLSLAFSFGFCVLLQWRHTGLPLLCVLGLLGGYLWQQGTLALSVESLLWTISKIYNSGYGWGVLSWSAQPLNQADLTYAFFLIACLTALGLSWSLSRGKGIWLGIGAALLPLICCIVLDDTVPATGYLYLLLLPLLLIAVTGAVRRQSEEQGLRLTLWLGLPVALALGVLFLAVPREGYDKQDGAVKLEQFAMDVVDWLKKPTLPEFPELQLPVTGDMEEQVNLANAGPKNKQNRIVMEVELAKNGTLYLRGRAFDTYDGKGWTAEQRLDNESYWPYTENMDSEGFVTVTTKEAHSVIYQPMYPCDNFWAEKLEYGCIPNSNGQKIYSAMQGTPQTYDDNLWPIITVPFDTLIGETNEDLLQASPDEPITSETGVWGDAAFIETEPLDESVWLELPGETKERAQTLLRSELGLRLPLSSDDMEAAAQKIIAYVRSSASYSLRTRRMPSGEDDFALWFLEDSDTGYCVHFATATTVLLRAAGIPARYVTGYMVTGAEGETVQVPAHASHAWSEYRLEGKIWKIAESTPPDGDSPVPSTQPRQTQAPTRPQETEPVNAPGETGPEDAVTEPEEVVPGGTDTPRQEEKSVDWTPLWTVFKVIGWIVFIAALIAGQWQLRLWLRRKHQRSGGANRRALARWQEVRLLSRLQKTETPEQLYELAQKAKFSQHNLTKEELAQFRLYQLDAHAVLRSRPWYWQLYYRLVLALY